MRTTAAADRQPPVALEAEISVLGACLIEPDAIGRVLEVHDEAAFYREGHRRIFRAMRHLHEAGDVVDPTQVVEALQGGGELDQVGGVVYIARLIDAVPTAANVEYHARTLLDRYRLRTLIAACEETVRHAHEGGDEGVEAIIDAAENRILGVAAMNHAGDMQRVRDLILPTMDRIDELQNSAGGITGVPTGLPDLDARTGGFQRGDLIIIAARPSMGKTALALSIVLHASITAQRHVAVFSYEMSTDQIMQRLLCAEGLVDLQLLRRGCLGDDEIARLVNAAGHLNTAPIHLDYSGNGRVPEIKGKCRRLARDAPLDLVVVDYLQLMTGGGNRENRNQEIGEISRGLKTLAMELGVPVIALSQLSRAPETRSNHRPLLADLRESGSIEQDADLVLFPYRPNYYDDGGDGDGGRSNDQSGPADIIIGKQRNGPTGSVRAYFRAECARFEGVTSPGTMPTTPLTLL